MAPTLRTAAPRRRRRREPTSADRVVPRYDTGGGTTRSGRAPTLKNVHSLRQVLIGRDTAPSWRSVAARRTAYAAAAAGWVLLGAAVVTVAILNASTRNAPGGAGGPDPAGWVAVSLAVGAALPLAPRYPLLAWRLAYLAVLFTPLIPGQNRVDTGYYTVLTIVFVVAGLRCRQPALWWMAALMLLPVWLWTGPDRAYPLRDTIGLAVLTAVLFGIGAWRGDRRELAAQTRLTERQRERNAVLEERARIAREMHDVVAHHMSMIAVQAETAPYRLAAKPGGSGLPEPVREEFAALGQAARDALTDMRALLGVLRSPDNSKTPADGGEGGESAGDRPGAPSAQSAPGGPSGEAELAPQPRLDDVPDLVAGARRSGARVTLRMPDNSKKLPRGVGLAVYRIVQESLSNAARHAPGAAISVVVEQTAPDVRITVKNDPPATSQPRTGGTGHGLTGMRERVALLGGQLRTGPEPDGGFAVRAVLPANGTAANSGAASAPDPRAASRP
jgi:signal transduction histidine kinase